MKNIKETKKEEIKKYQELARQGNPRDQAILGKLLMDSDPDQSFDLNKKSAEQDDDMGITNLAGCYFHGIGTEKSYEEGLKWVKIFGEKSRENMWTVGEVFQKGGGVLKQDNKEALRWYKKAAEKGWPEYQVRVAYIYENGEGLVKRDLQEAARWCEVAANEGYPRGQYYLGIMYFKGSGVKQSVEKALEWFEKASKGNFIKANFMMAYLRKTEKELMVKRLNEEVENIFKQSTHLNIFHELPPCSDVPCLIEEEIIWLKECAEKGVTVAQVVLGQFYLLNNKQEKAYKCFSKADDVVGKYYLAIFYGMGCVVSKNSSKAKKFLNEVVGIINAGKVKNQEMARNAFLQDKISEFNEKIFEKEIRNSSDLNAKIRRENSANYDAQFLVRLETQARDAQELLEKKIRLDEKERKLDEEEIKFHEKEKTQREMLSFLTHSLNNSLGSVQSNLDRTIEILKDSYQSGSPQHKAVNNIMSLSSTFLMIENMIDTFRGYIYEPDNLLLSWGNDTHGTVNNEIVIASALRQAITILLFRLDSYLPNLARKDAGIDIKDLRAHFLEQIQSIEIENSNVDSIFNWAEKYLNIRISIDKTEKMHFSKHGIRYMLMLCFMSEIILNSFKYCKEGGYVQINWGCKSPGNKYIFQCLNEFIPNSRIAGSQKGLLFIQGLFDNLGTSEIITEETDDGFFKVELIFDDSQFQ